MELLEKTKQKIAQLITCDSAYILAHAAWSACDHRRLPGPSIFEISVALDSGNKSLINDLSKITSQPDYSNAAQAEMLRWLHQSGYSKYIAKQIKTTTKKLVDWI